MSGRGQIKILSACRKLLKLMNLGTKSKFQIGQLEIPNIIVFAILLLPLSYLITMEMRTIYNIRFNFKDGADHFFITLGTTQLQLIFLSLITNNSVIIDTVDHIQDVVDRSKVYFFINIAFKKLFKHCSIPF